MAYTRTTTIDANPAGDTTKAAIVDKLDVDLSGAFTNLNTHEALTTGAHGITGTIVGTVETQSLSAKTIVTATITGTTTCAGATFTGGNMVNQTILTPTLTGAVTCAGATLTGGNTVNQTILTPTITGTVTASGATFTSGTYVYPKITSYKTLWVPVGAMIPTTTNGAAAGINEYSTNDNMYDYLAFDSATTEYAGFNAVLDENYDLSTVKAKFYWTASSDSATVGNTVEWKIAGIASSDGDTIDTATGTPQLIVDTLVTGESAILHVSDATPAVTIAGTPALNDTVHFKVWRSVAGTDNMLIDAWLFGVNIQYGISGTIGGW